MSQHGVGQVDGPDEDCLTSQLIHVPSRQWVDPADEHLLSQHGVGQVDAHGGGCLVSQLTHTQSHHSVDLAVESH